MHVSTTILAFAAAFIWGDWRNWVKYYSTMQFIALGNLTYSLICTNYFLWRFVPESFSNYTITDLTYTFIVLPASTLLFLSKYPEGSFYKKVIYYLKWIIVFIGFEYLFLINNGIVHLHGWSIWWSLAFVTFMFPLLRLHYKKPLLGCLCAIFIGVFITLYFRVPVNIPIEFRQLSLLWRWTV